MKRVIGKKHGIHKLCQKLPVKISNIRASSNSTPTPTHPHPPPLTPTHPHPLLPNQNILPFTLNHLKNAPYTPTHSPPTQNNSDSLKIMPQ